MRRILAVTTLVGLAGLSFASDTYHLSHLRRFGHGVPSFNRLVLRGVDVVQAHQCTGGGYFIGVKAQPTESPIGYELKLGPSSLLAPPRETSFCSGASYSAFIEALNLHLRLFPQAIGGNQVEALRMQEPDGGRREDRIKAWGWWNADGFGNHFCLVQLMKAGVRVAPKEAMAGDFLNISWKTGRGHSTVFLAWEKDAAGTPGVRYWSSQTSTNGLGDQWSPIDLIESVCVVRCTNPERAFTFDPANPVDTKVKGDTLH